MKKLLFTLALGLWFVPAWAEEPVAEETHPLSTTLTAGYDSRYVLYGYRLSRHLYHVDAYSSYALNDRTTLWAGAWYGYLTDGTYREVDGYAGIDRALGNGFSVGFGYSLFHYIEVPFTDKDWDHEFAVHVSYYTEKLFLSLRDQYDVEAEGHLARAIAAYTQPVSDRLSLVASAEFGYAFDYYIEGNRANHTLWMLKAPIRITDHVVATPFIARSIPLDAIDEYEENETYGGISISWTL